MSEELVEELVQQTILENSIFKIDDIARAEIEKDQDNYLYMVIPKGNLNIIVHDPLIILSITIPGTYLYIICD